MHKARLTERELDLSPVSGAEAISLLTRLSRESHQLAQHAEPAYTRDQIPCRFVRGRLT